MAITFVKTKKLGATCILPCPIPTLTPKISVPFSAPGFEMSGGGMLKLTGGCTDCNLAIDLFAKISPYILSLGIPLCILQCAASLITLVTDTVDVAKGTVSLVTGIAEVPPKFPTPAAVQEVVDKLTKVTGDPTDGDPVGDIALVAQDCACILDVFGPQGFCPFMKLMRDLLRLIAALLNCFATLLGDILKVSLTAQFMRRSPTVRVQSQGVCLGSIARDQLNRLNVQMDVVWALLGAAEVLFKFVEGIADPLIPGGYPPDAKISAILGKVTIFQAKAAGTQTANIDLVIPQCTELRDAAFEIRDVLNGVANTLNTVISVVCLP